MSKMSQLHARMVEDGEIDPDFVDDSGAPGLPACEICGLVVSEEIPGHEGGLRTYAGGGDDRVCVHERCPGAKQNLDDEAYYRDCCQTCGGSGGGPEHFRCPSCGGTGAKRMSRERQYNPADL